MKYFEGPDFFFKKGVQWTPLNVITFVNTKNDNNNRLITLTEKMKIAIL